MMPLIRNELYKLFRMKKLYIFAAVMVVVLVLNLYNYEPGEDPMVIWTFMYGQSVPLNTLDFLTQFMVIFIPILAGDSVTQEYRRGHMKLSLLRPVLRSELLLAKLAALLVFIIVMALFYTAASYAIGSYYLGWGDGTEYAGRIVSAAEGVRLTLSAVALLTVPYMAYGLFAAAIAVLSRNMSFTIICTLVIITIALNLNIIEAIAPYSLAYQMVFYHEAFIASFDKSLALQRTGVIALYAAVFAALSFAVFRKKEMLY